MGSGLFDEYPRLRVILGHLGEGVPFGIWRVDHRILKLGLQTKAKLSMSQYLRENFYVTTSGNFRTQALTDVMLEIGADRVLYSVDYPYEDMGEATDWFDHARPLLSQTASKSLTATLGNCSASSRRMQRERTRSGRSLAENQIASTTVLAPHTAKIRAQACLVFICVDQCLPWVTRRSHLAITPGLSAIQKFAQSVF
jgi:hypothetical protein